MTSCLCDADAQGQSHPHDASRKLQNLLKTRKDCRQAENDVFVFETMLNLKETQSKRYVKTQFPNSQIRLYNLVKQIRMFTEGADVTSVLQKSMTILSFISMWLIDAIGLGFCLRR